MKGGVKMNGIVQMPARLVSDTDLTDDDLAKINRHALKPLTRDEVFAFDGICSSDALDSYFTRMDPHSTLRNFAEDLITGTALLDGHDTDKTPYGRSFDSEIIEKDGTTLVRGRWYIVRGLTLNGANTDDTIKAIESGVIRDMSVGFGGNGLWYKCSADGRDIWDTPYYPGDVDEDGNTVFFWIVDARLREVSTVYKGACPDAYIEKARADSEIQYEKIKQLENRYQVRIDDGQGAFSFTKKGEKERMNLLEQLRQELKENKLERKAVYDVLSEGNETFRQPDDIALRNALGEDATEQGVKTLKQMAENGRKYKEDLVDEAVKERVAVQGDSFNSENYKSLLNRADIDFIKEEAESYRKMKGDKFTSGRQTQPADPMLQDNEEVIEL